MYIHQAEIESARSRVEVIIIRSGSSAEIASEAIFNNARSRALLMQRPISMRHTRYGGGSIEAEIAQTFPARLKSLAHLYMQLIYIFFF